MNQLDAQKQFTAVEGDTSVPRQIAAFKPKEVTSNPSLLRKAVQMPELEPLLKQTLTPYRASPLNEVMDRLLVGIGSELQSHVPGRVLTEVNARLNVYKPATVARAERIIEQYEALGPHIARVLINQAVTCGQSKITLISHIVGLIYDRHKKAAGPGWDEDRNSGADEPKVRSVLNVGILAFVADKFRLEHQLLAA